MSKVLPDLQAEAKATLEGMIEEMAKLKAENGRLRQGQALSVKLSAKGAISVCGIGRFPVTLYKSQWTRVLEEQTIADIRALFPQAKDKE